MKKSRAKIKSVDLVLLGPRNETLCPANCSYLAVTIKVMDVFCTLLFLIGIRSHIAYSTEVMPWQKKKETSMDLTDDILK